MFRLFILSVFLSFPVYAQEGSYSKEGDHTLIETKNVAKKFDYNRLLKMKANLRKQEASIDKLIQEADKLGIIPKPEQEVAEELILNKPAKKK